MFLSEKTVISMYPKDSDKKINKLEQYIADFIMAIVILTNFLNWSLSIPPENIRKPEVF